MAPIPEENKDNKTPTRDGDDIDHFSNPDLVSNLDVTASSDEEDLDPTAGYSLLPQEPGDDDCSDSSDEDDVTQNNNNNNNDEQTRVDASQTPEVIPDSVLVSESGASAPTVSASLENCHSAFLAKFPDGKVPSYMHVPPLPKDKDPHLWNQKREDKGSKFDKDSKILKAMSGFSLPMENIPEWAKNLSEDQWKQQILTHIGKTDSGDEQISSQAAVSHQENTPGTEESSHGGDLEAKSTSK